MKLCEWVCGGGGEGGWRRYCQSWLALGAVSLSEKDEIM